MGLVEHRRSYDAPGRVRRDWLLDAIERSGLRGRGGAGFPAATKISAVAERRGHVVVVNATEGEPASAKDRLLCTASPHLVLDGAELAALAVGAGELIVCIDEDNRPALCAVARAIEERRRAGEPVPRVVATPTGYVTGEQSSLVRFLNGGPALPMFRLRPFESGVAGRPTLVHNAETLAQLALIARNGPEWFRECGTADEPGTMLFTVSLGTRETARVVEAEIGIRGGELLGLAGYDPEDPTSPAFGSQAVLVGGYFGRWVTREGFDAASYSRPGLAPLGASPGAGIVIVMPAGACGLWATARLLDWFAAESAGQCGPCVHGLPALASTTTLLASRGARPDDVERLRRCAGQIAGRGACHHPDGAVGLLRSALEVFAEDVERHLSGRPCTAEHPVAP
jgi:NADH:ubiquinone oxidoreductase subunit F (NADH-binding)